MDKALSMKIFRNVNITFFITSVAVYNHTLETRGADSQRLGLTFTSSFFKMRLFFQSNVLAVFIVMTVKGDGSSSSCPKPYDKMMVCNLMCNLLQDSSANDAMKLLQAKLESLVAVMNKPAITKGKL